LIFQQLFVGDAQSSSGKTVFDNEEALKLNQRRNKSKTISISNFDVMYQEIKYHELK